jgi:hypothetical protein
MLCLLSPELVFYGRGCNILGRPAVMGRRRHRAGGLSRGRYQKNERSYYLQIKMLSAGRAVRKRFLRTPRPRLGKAACGSAASATGCVAEIQPCVHDAMNVEYALGATFSDRQ